MHCPECGTLMIPDARDVHQEIKGVKITIPQLQGEYCACGEGVHGPEESKRAMEIMRRELDKYKAAA